MIRKIPHCCAEGKGEIEVVTIGKDECDLGFEVQVGRVLLEICS